jgi:hypothetical protein
MLMRRLWCSFVVALAIGSGPLAAQGRQVTGKVTEEGSGAPIPSAQVQVRGTTTGVLTREDGTFSVRVPTGEAVLVVRRLGYPPVEARVAADATTIDIRHARRGLHQGRVPAR